MVATASDREAEREGGAPVFADAAFVVLAATETNLMMPGDAALPMSPPVHAQTNQEPPDELSVPSIAQWPGLH